MSGGSVQFMRNESSNPTIEISPGTVRPARRAARIAPSAMRSLAQTIAVTPSSISRAAPAWAASIEYHARAIRSGPIPMPARVAIATAAATFRREGMWSAGPARTPIRAWPSERRWPIACSTATVSSHDTRGNPRPSIDAFTRTVGRPRSASRA